MYMYIDPPYAMPIKTNCWPDPNECSKFHVPSRAYRSLEALALSLYTLVRPQGDTYTKIRCEPKIIATTCICTLPPPTIADTQFKLQVENSNANTCTLLMHLTYACTHTGTVTHVSGKITIRTNVEECMSEMNPLKFSHNTLYMYMLVGVSSSDNVLTTLSYHSAISGWRMVLFSTSLKLEKLQDAIHLRGTKTSTCTCT